MFEYDNAHGKYYNLLRQQCSYLMFRQVIEIYVNLIITEHLIVNALHGSLDYLINTVILSLFQC